MTGGGFLGGAWELFQRSYIIVTLCLCFCPGMDKKWRELLHKSFLLTRTTYTSSERMTCMQRESKEGVTIVAELARRSTLHFAGAVKKNHLAYQ